ncbi:MAG: SIS domain-containing protein [Candidatus Woesearchaeota archaeon]
MEAGNTYRDYIEGHGRALEVCIIMEDRIRRELAESILVKRSIMQKLVPKIQEASEIIIEAYKNGGRLIAFGNGGSAADSQHIVAELVNQLYISGRPMLDAISLTVNTSVLTAIGNDSSYDDVFARQIESLAKPRDIVLGISTSGNSENVNKALLMAKQKGAKTIGFTGATGGKMNDLGVDLLIRVQSSDVARIQEGHITIGHIICSLVEKELFLGKPGVEMNKVMATAPARISFANGGDTDYYIKDIGWGCIVNATLSSHYFKCVASRGGEGISVKSYNMFDDSSMEGSIESLELNGDDFDLMRATIKEVYPEFKGEIQIETNVPMKSGMGGSSSLNVALIAALSKLKGEHIEKEDVAKLAYKIERDILGVKGGYQDQWAASYGGGFNYMEFHPGRVDVMPLRLNEEQLMKLEGRMCMAYLGKRSVPGSHIHDDQKKVLGTTRVNEMLVKKRNNTKVARDALLLGDIEKTGEMLHKEYEIKKVMSTKISDEYFNDLYSSAISAGAIGGKISGAGAGGCAFFLCKEGKKEEVASTLRAKGAVVLDLRFQRHDDPGYNIEVLG